jgi:hypothetical protein
MQFFQVYSRASKTAGERHRSRCQPRVRHPRPDADGTHGERL